MGVKDQPLDVFGLWQTEKAIPPPAKDGVVPRNEYGNVELFKPWMLPEGTVHIPHQVFDGFVVCKEHQVLMDAWNTDIEEKAKKDAAKKEKRVLDNWRKLVKGMLTAEKIKRKYL